MSFIMNHLFVFIIMYFLEGQEVFSTQICNLINNVQTTKAVENLLNPENPLGVYKKYHIEEVDISNLRSRRLNNLRPDSLPLPNQAKRRVVYTNPGEAIDEVKMTDEIYRPNGLYSAYSDLQRQQESILEAIEQATEQGNAVELMALKKLQIKNANDTLTIIEETLNKMGLRYNLLEIYEDGQARFAIEILPGPNKVNMAAGDIQQAIGSKIIYDPLDNMANKFNASFSASENSIRVPLDFWDQLFITSINDADTLHEVRHAFHDSLYRAEQLDIFEGNIQLAGVEEMGPDLLSTHPGRLPGLKQGSSYLKFLSLDELETYPLGAVVEIMNFSNNYRGEVFISLLKSKLAPRIKGIVEEMLDLSFGVEKSIVMAKAQISEGTALIEQFSEGERKFVRLKFKNIETGDPLDVQFQLPRNFSGNSQEWISHRLDDVLSLAQDRISMAQTVLSKFAELQKIDIVTSDFQKAQTWCAETVNILASDSFSP